MSLANPVLVFGFIWSIVLLFHSCRLLALLEPLNSTAIYLVISNISIFIIMFIFTSFIIHPSSVFTIRIRKNNTTLNDNDILALEKYVRPLFIFWIIGTLINIFYSGGIPLYWMMKGTTLDYRDYGIPTFGGLIASINAFLAVSYFLIYLNKPRTKIFFMFLIQMLWPILAVSRGNFTYIFLEIVGSYLIIKKISIKQLMIIFLLSVLFINVMGVIGDFRLGTERSEGFRRGLLHHDYIHLAEKIPSGFFYFYAYITTPFNNVVYNINSIKPDFKPFYSTIFLFPTVIRGLIFDESASSDLFNLVNPSFNTTTFYSGYLSDFGILGTILIVSVFQFGSILFYRQALKGRLSYIIAYSVVFQCIVLSVFNDNFTMHMSIFQVLLALYFENKYKKNHYCPVKIKSPAAPRSSRQRYVPVSQ